jgi:hypothetical protein
MTHKAFVPFGGVCGWLADLTNVPKSRQPTTAYYAAEPDSWRAMAAIRVHAGAKKDAILIPRRALSKQEIGKLGLKPGQVKTAS